MHARLGDAETRGLTLAEILVGFVFVIILAA